MAVVELHPQVENYLIELSLSEIEARGGVADLVEEGKVIIIRDLRLDLDYSALESLGKSTEAVVDDRLRSQLKKLEATAFFEGERPRKRWRGFKFDNPVRQALFDTICNGDSALFERAARTLRQAHDEALQIFGTCFAGYEAYRLIPSVRLTRTLFENLHWDEHWIDGDFHTARVFANLDRRPRIWHLSHRFPEMLRLLYREHDLARFAGRDPNELLSYINATVLGGLTDKWKESLPKHRVAFEPGEVWLAESRLVSHQIYYGEAALVYMWLVRTESMSTPENRFDRVVQRVHDEMRATETAALPTGAA
jgi:hypothetical protein